MKAIRIHPVSALAGAGMLGLVLLAVGAVQAPTIVRELPVCPSGVRVVGIPDPRTMVVVKEGTPFVVPSGKILVLTALGAAMNGIVVDLLIDGLREVQSVANIPTAGPATIGDLPSGLTAGSGSTVEVSSGSVYGRAWGYLVST